MTQSGKSFLENEEQRNSAVNKLSGRTTNIREHFQEIKNAQDAKATQDIQAPEEIVIMPEQTPVTRVNAVTGGEIDENGWTTYNKDGYTVKVGPGEYKNAAKEKAAELPELEEKAKKTEGIETEKEGWFKRAIDTSVYQTAKFKDTWLGKKMKYIPIVGPLIQLDMEMEEKWLNEMEDEVYLSNGKLITSVPAIQDPDKLTDMKALANNILEEYAINGNVVTAAQIKEKYPQYKNISDQTLDNYVGGAITAYANGTPINRDIVAKNYSSMSLMEGYTGERQQELDMFTDEDIMTYGISQDLYEQMEKDENVGKLVAAYNAVKYYVDVINQYGMNHTGASDWKIANTYRNNFAFDGMMSLDEAMTTIETYDQKRLQSLMGAIKTRYDNVLDREIDEATFAKNQETLYNVLNQSHALVNFINESFDYATDDFLEYYADQYQEMDPALKWTPASWMGNIATKWIMGNMYIDDNGNYRDIKGNVVFSRQEDGSYMDKSGKTVQEITGLQKGWLRSNVNALTSILEGATDVVEGVAMEKEGGAGNGYAIQALAGVASSIINALMLTRGKNFMIASSTPGFIGRGLDGIFQASMEIGGNTLLGLFNIAQLTDTRTDESKEALKELGGLLITAYFSKKVGNSEYYRSIKEAAKRVWNKYADNYIQILSNTEYKEKIRKPEGKLEDKTTTKEVVDTEGKTIGEIKEELAGKERDVESGKETKTEKTEVKEKKTTGEEKVTVKGEESKGREVVDVTSTKDKIGYTLQLNKAIAKEMLNDFRKELKKINQQNASKSALYDVLSENPKRTQLKDALFGSTKNMLGTLADVGTEILKTIGQAAKNVITLKPVKNRIIKKAYKKMGLAEESVKTIENNSKIGQLGKIFHELIGKGGERLKNVKNIEKYVKERVAKMREEEAKRIQKELERIKEEDISKELYGKLSDVQNIRMSDFFTGKRLMKAIQGINKNKDISPYVRIYEFGGKMYIELVPGYGKRMKEGVAEALNKLVHEYNEIMENGKVSEQNILDLVDTIKEMVYDKDPVISNAGNAIKQQLLSYLEEKKIANKVLQGEKASAEIHELYKMFTGLYKEPKGAGKRRVNNDVSPDKVVKFLESLTDEQLARLEEYIPGTRETIDLLKNGATVVKEFADRFRKGKEIETWLGEKGRKARERGKDTNNSVLKYVGLMASRFHSPKLGAAMSILALGISLTSRGFKLAGKGWDKLANKKVRDHLQKVLDKNPEGAKQLEEQSKGVEQGIQKLNNAIAAVIKSRERELPQGPSTTSTTPTTPATQKRPQGPNRRPYDTSVTNRTFYDESTAEPKDVTRNAQNIWMPGDSDMVVSDQNTLTEEEKKRLTDSRQYLTEEERKRLTDERQYLTYKEDQSKAEADLEEALTNLETYVDDMIQTLQDIVNGDGGEDGGNGGPKTSDGGDGDGLTDFINGLTATSPEQGEGRPSFKNRSNESLKKLIDKDGNFKEGVPEEFHQEIINELNRREVKKQTDDSEIRTQNNIIRAILEQLDQIAEGKAEDNIRAKYNEQVMQAWNKDTNEADNIILGIVNGKITESDVYQNKTIYEDNQEASKWIEKRTGKKTTPTKSASKTSSLEVRDTKPDSQGKLNALKSQLATKKKAKPTKKRQEEINKLEKEIARLEEKLNNRELDNMDIEAQKAIDESIAEEEKPQVQPSEEKNSERQEEQSSTMDDLMTFRVKDKSPEEIKKVQAELTKRKNENNLDGYSTEDVDRQLKTLNQARIGKQNEKSKKEDVQEVEDAIQEDLKALSEMAFETVYQGGRKSYEQVNLQHVGEGEGAAAHGFGIYVAKDPTVAGRYLFSNREYVGKELSPEATNMLDGILLRMSDDRLTFKEALESEKELMKEGGADGSDVIKELEKISQKDLVPVGAPDGTYKGQNVFDMDSKEGDVLQDIYAQAEEYANEYDMNMTKKDLQRALDNYITNEYGEHSKAEINIAKKINVDDFGYTTPTIHEIQIPKQQKAKTPTGELYLDEGAIVNKKAREQIAKELEKQPTDGIYSKEALKEIREKDLDGGDLYMQITRYLGEQEYASEFLRKQGYGGIKYTGGKDGECYVIFGPESTQVINKFNKDNRNNFSS